MNDRKIPWRSIDELIRSKTKNLEFLKHNTICHLPHLKSGTMNLIDNHHYHKRIASIVGHMSPLIVFFLLYQLLSECSHVLSVDLHVLALYSCYVTSRSLISRILFSIALYVT